MLARIQTNDRERHLVHLEVLLASETKEMECLRWLIELLS